MAFDFMGFSDASDINFYESWDRMDNKQNWRRKHRLLEV